MTLLAFAGTALVRNDAAAQGRLPAAGHEVLRAVAQAVLQGSLPAAPALRSRVLESLRGRMEDLVAALPDHARTELSQLLVLLSSSIGRRWFAGLEADWPQAGVAQVEQALQGMRMSRLAARQQAYLALHEIVSAAYFSDPATWEMLGYAGPAPIRADTT